MTTIKIEYFLQVALIAKTIYNTPFIYEIFKLPDAFLV